MRLTWSHRGFIIPKRIVRAEEAAWRRGVPAALRTTTLRIGFRNCTIAPDDLTQIFVQAADNPSYLEASAARVFVAAAEVIAALNGSPTKGVPPEIVKWTTNRQASTPELKALALRALERVRKDSELKPYGSKPTV